MPRPKRGTSETFYDTFSSFPLEEQAIALRIMQETYRQAQKLARTQQPKTDPEASAAKASPTCCDTGMRSGGMAHDQRCSQGSRLDGTGAETVNGGSKGKL